MLLITIIRASLEKTDKNARRSWNTNVTEDHSWWVSNHEKITLQEFEFLKKNYQQYCRNGRPFGGSKVEAVFLVALLHHHRIPPNFFALPFPKPPKKWDVTRDMSDKLWPSSIDKTPRSKQGVLQCLPRSRFTTSILPSHWTDLDTLLQRHWFGCWQSLWLPGAWKGSLVWVLKIGCWGSSLGNKPLGYESMYGGKLSFCDTLDYIHAFQEVYSSN